MVSSNGFKLVDRWHLFFRRRCWVFIRIHLYFDGLPGDRLPTCLLKGLTVHRSLPVRIETQIVRSVFGSLRSNVCFGWHYLLACSNDCWSRTTNSDWYLGDLLRIGLNTIFSGGVSGVCIWWLGVSEALIVQGKRSFWPGCFHVRRIFPPL